MSYYSAGGYYQAGGFSFKKLGRFIGRTAAAVTHNPVLQAGLSFLPGASTVLQGFSIIDSVGASAHNAIANSNAGTPGHVARFGSLRRRRRRRRSY